MDKVKVLYIGHQFLWPLVVYNSFLISDISATHLLLLLPRILEVLPFHMSSIDIYLWYFELHLSPTVLTTVVTQSQFSHDLQKNRTNKEQKHLPRWAGVILNTNPRKRRNEEDLGKRAGPTRQQACNSTNAFTGVKTHKADGLTRLRWNQWERILHTKEVNLMDKDQNSVPWHFWYCRKNFWKFFFFPSVEWLRDLELF